MRTGAADGCREQPAKMIRGAKNAARLQYTGFQGHEIFEFLRVAKSCELGLFHVELAILKAFFQRFADIQQSPVVLSRFGVMRAR